MCLADEPARRVYRIGVLLHSSRAAFTGGFLTDALREQGYVAGKNLTIEFRSADGRSEKLPALADELIRLRPDVIVTPGTPETLAAKEATRTIPIVMSTGINPVDTGIVASLSRPGGNVTGATWFGQALGAKRLEMIHGVLPSLRRAAVLLNKDNPAAAPLLAALEESARVLDIGLRTISARGSDELTAGISGAKEQALVVMEMEPFMSNEERIAELALKNRIASIGPRSYCERGGLLGYGVDFRQHWRETAGLIARILSGARPADLPIQQATRFALVINLATATRLGLSIPGALRARADQIIE